MDVAELAAKIETEYEMAMRYDKQIAALYAKVSNGTATYAEAEKFASMSGQHIGNILAKSIETNYPEGIALDEAMDLIPPPLRKNHQYVTGVTRQIQQTLNEKAGIGLKAIVPEVDAEQSANIARAVAQGISREQLLKEVENSSMKIVDRAEQQNAAAHASAGLEVLVTREYDDVGVHNGKDVCEWCVSRCGIDMPYSEAYEKGAFERHPGCGCVITYTSKKGVVTRQSRAGGNWEEVSSRDISERKRHGL